MASQGIGPVYSLYQSTLEVANDGEALTVLDYYNVGARVLARNGDSVVFDYAGSFIVDSVDCHIYLAFNGGTILDFTFTAGHVYSDFHLFGRIIRSGPSTQTAVATLSYDTNKAISFTVSLSKDDTAANPVELYGEQADPGTITLKLAHLTFQAAPS